jgi:hypothetical protein
MKNDECWNRFALSLLFYPVIWKEQVVLVVGAASSRDYLISRLEAAPTEGFLW